MAFNKMYHIVQLHLWKRPLNFTLENLAGALGDACTLSSRPLSNAP